MKPKYFVEQSPENTNRIKKTQSKTTERRSSLTYIAAAGIRWSLVDSSRHPSSFALQVNRYLITHGNPIKHQTSMHRIGKLRLPVTRCKGKRERAAAKTTPAGSSGWLEMQRVWIRWSAERGRAEGERREGLI